MASLSLNNICSASQDKVWLVSEPVYSCAKTIIHIQTQCQICLKGNHTTEVYVYEMPPKKPVCWGHRVNLISSSIRSPAGALSLRNSIPVENSTKYISKATGKVIFEEGNQAGRKYQFGILKLIIGPYQLVYYTSHICYTLTLL